MGMCDTDSPWIPVAALPSWMPISGWEVWTTTELGGSSLHWMPGTEREKMEDSFEDSATESLWMPVVSRGLSRGSERKATAAKAFARGITVSRRIPVVRGRLGGASLHWMPGTEREGVRWRTRQTCLSAQNRARRPFRA